MATEAEKVMNKNFFMAMNRVDALIAEIKSLKKSIDKIAEIFDVKVTEEIKARQKPEGGG